MKSINTYNKHEQQVSNQMMWECSWSTLNTIKNPSFFKTGRVTVKHFWLPKFSFNTYISSLYSYNYVYLVYTFCGILRNRDQYKKIKLLSLQCNQKHSEIVAIDTIIIISIIRYDFYNSCVGIQNSNVICLNTRLYYRVIIHLAQ